MEHLARRMLHQDFHCAETRSPGRQPGVVVVEAPAVLGLCAVAVVRGAEGGVGTLVGAGREDEDPPGGAGLDDAVGAGRGQVVRASRPGGARENRGGTVRAMTWTFMPCCLCFGEWYGSSAAMRSVGIRAPST